MDTKTDRELIELAAKSMGLKGYWCDMYGGRLVVHRGVGLTPYDFNPIKYEKGIFDLIAYHKIGVHFADMDHNGTSHKVAEVFYSHIDSVYQSEAVSYEADQGKALARAVLLAAAKIGEGME